MLLTSVLIAHYSPKLYCSIIHQTNNISYITLYYTFTVIRNYIPD